MKKRMHWIGISGLIFVTLIGIWVPTGKVLEKVKEKPLKFGATYMTMNNPYFPALNESIREGVEANGDILITRDPAQNQERQNAQIEEMIEEGVSGIFLNPVDWMEVAPALKRCAEEGIPVFNIDTDVYNTEYVATVIQSDNYQAGVQCAEDMMKKKKTAKILIMDHYNIRSTTQRVQGFLDTIQGREEYEYEIAGRTITTSEFEVSMQEMKKLLENGVEFDVVLGGNDPTALGALAGLQANHVEVKDRILIYGIDGSPDAKEMINKGYLEGSSSQQPVKMGRLAVEMAYAYLRGEEIEKDVAVDVIMVTKENLDEFNIDGWL